MSPKFRGRIFNQAVVNAPASDVWGVITDWAGTDKLRRPDVDPGPLKVKSVDLIGDPNGTPRTRVFQFEGDFGEVRETLFHQCDEMRHLYYNIEGTGPLGIRNYLATTDVDELSSGVSQITITARFDVPENVDIVKAKTVINAAHMGVILGVKHYLKG